MKKIYLLLSISLLIGINSAFAQSKSIKDLYWDYSMVRMEPFQNIQATNLALALLTRKAELNSKQIANVNYHLGRLYEESNQMEKAIPYYENSIKLTPGYYVPYLALGNYYFKDCKEMILKMNEAAKANDVALHEKITEDYKKIATKTAEYLEHSYACDPDEITQGMITYLYQTSKNTTATKTFDARIKKLAESCVTLLDD
jgi:tetratricopeptide (TPR) repeat protein